MRELYDKIGEAYIKAQKEVFSKREDLARKFITKSLGDIRGKKVLDVGCGAGVDVETYEKLGAEVYGIDSSEYMVKQAKENVSNPEKIFLQKMDSLQFRSNFFDIVTGRFSMHYLEYFDNFYLESARVLKKDGLMIQIAHHPIRDLYLTQERNYTKQQILQMELYNTGVPIEFPTHTFAEYFSPLFLSLFNLEDYTEQSEALDEYVNEWKIPGFLGFKARKR